MSSFSSRQAQPKVHGLAAHDPGWCDVIRFIRVSSYSRSPKLPLPCSSLESGLLLPTLQMGLGSAISTLSVQGGATSVFPSLRPHLTQVPL